MMQWEKTEHEKCYTFDKDQENTCKGASGRKLRQVCIWCPNYQKGEKKENEKSD